MEGFDLKRAAVLALVMACAPALANPINSDRPKSEPKKPGVKFSLGKNQALKIVGSGEMFGHTELVISNLGFVQHSNIGYSVWRNERPNEFMMVNPENKTYLVVNFDDWFKEKRQHFPDQVKAAVVDGTDSLVSGFAVTKSTGFKSSAKGGRGLKLWEVYRLSGFSPQGRGFAVLRRTLGFAEAGDLPVGASQLVREISDDGSRTDIVRVAVIPKTIQAVDIKESLYKPAPGFKRVTDRAALYMGDGSGSESVEDIFMRKL